MCDRSQQREKVESRRFFSVDEKRRIRKKSNGLCSHCGKILTDEIFTVDHAIPLDKGGTNDLSNLVALCNTCNIDKDNFIYHPREYFKYLNEPFLEELIDNQNKYYDTVHWLTKTNFLPEEVKEFSVPIELPNLQYKKRKGLSPVSIKYMLHKAVYSDLDSIYHFLIRYHSKFADTSTNQDIKELIMDYFENGCIYFIKNRSDEVIALLPLRVSTYCKNIKSEFNNITVFNFNNFITIKDDVNICNILNMAFIHILHQLIDLKISNEGYICFVVSYCKNNIISSTIGSDIEKTLTLVKISEDDEFRTVLCFATRSEHTVKFPKDISYNGLMRFSQNLQYRLYGNKGVPEWDKIHANIIDEDVFTIYNHRYEIDNYIKEKSMSDDIFSALDDNIKINKAIESLGIVERKKEKLEYEGDLLIRKKVLNTLDIDDLVSRNETDGAKVFSIPFEAIIVTNRAKLSGKISGVARQNMKRGVYVPLKVNQYLELVDGFDVYNLLKSSNSKSVNCIMSFQSGVKMHEYNDYDEFNTIVERQNNRCYICNRVLDENNLKPVLTLLKPKSRGGMIDLNNVVACCKLCNSLKGNFNWSSSLEEIIKEELRFRGILKEEIKNDNRK